MGMDNASVDRSSAALMSTVTPGETAAEGDPSSAPKGSTRLLHRLPLWATVFIGIATVGPTMAMAGNGQGIISSVGKGVPLAFVLGLVAVGLVGYGFIRLTRHIDHAGSAYALVGATVGPRAGFFSGFAMIGCYLGFSISCIAIFAAFVNDWLLQVQNGRAHAFQLPWIIPALVAIAGSALLAGRDTKSIARVLMAFEGCGIVAMFVLVTVIFAKGGAPTTGFSLSVFSVSHGVTASAILYGVVAAFLSWAGFESCAALGEETTNPHRNIPRALFGTLAVTGILFVVVMYAQTIGFGTNAAGLSAFQHSANTLGSLGTEYVGSWFSLIVVITAICSAFAAHLGAAAASSRMMFAYSRDGFGPRWMAKVAKKTNSPRNAMWLVIGLCLVVMVISYTTGWPVMGTGNPALDTYTLFAYGGTVAMIVAYFMVEVAAIKFVIMRAKIDHGLVMGVSLLTIGTAVIVAVLYENVKGQHSYLSSPPYLGLTWCAIGLVIALLASRLTRRVGKSLTAELGDLDLDVTDDVRLTDAQFMTAAEPETTSEA